MPFLIGILLSAAVAVFARVVGLDRERAFYSTVLVVVGSYYVLFAAMSGSVETVVVESVLMAGFAGAAVAGFRWSSWITVAGLAGHGVFDALRGGLIENSGVPVWWPAFCGAYDVGAAAILGWLEVRRRTPADRLRYTIWAPAYDRLVRAAGFDAARRVSIDRLRLAPGDRVLMVGAGTGLDLDFLPPDVDVTAIDVTPAMLKQLERRAAGAGRPVTARIMDARQLAFPDASFDAIVMHLILAVMPDADRGMSEAVRVLKPGGRIAVFDKFLRDDERPSLTRRLLNVFAKPLFSDLNRRLGPLMAGTRLVVERDEAVAFGGSYRVATLSSPGR